MTIRNFLHKGLARLFVDDSTRGIPASAADKLRKQLAFLEAMQDADELRTLPLWRAHPLTGDRNASWSLSVTKNWRLTFRVDSDGPEICDVNLEDYH